MNANVGGILMDSSPFFYARTYATAARPIVNKNLFIEFQTFEAKSFRTNNFQGVTNLYFKKFKISLY